jgi:acetyl-CoA decarbonylase/synthase complex subunit gamma
MKIPEDIVSNNAPRPVPGQKLAEGWVTTPAGEIPRVVARLNWKDRVGAFLVRFAIGRMDYAVEPGLYAVGSPGPGSPVLVSANYKLSFDHLRSKLAGVDAWILVLDTKGINVWCAAGKGTFGTDEIVRRVEAVKLAEAVTGRVLPQLGAPGVSAHEVTRRTRFKVVYGPVRAADIPEFLRAGMKAGPVMRRVRFDLVDRVALIPVELVIGTKTMLMIAAVLVLAGGLGTGGYSIDRAAEYAPAIAGIALGAFLASVILVPVLLPWLPGKAFSLKGAWLGIALAAILFVMARAGFVPVGGWMELYGLMAGLITLASFIAMNFTGASTYTSLSGVIREMKTAVPLQKALAVVAAGLWLAGRFVR